MTYPKGSKPTICNCPFTDWCEDGRQSLQELFRKENKNYKVEDCDFYKLIKERTSKIETVECEECGGTGFSKEGTGYDSVCDNCGGKGELPK